MRADTSKTSADAAAVLTENALKMLEPARAEIDALEVRLKSARERVSNLEEALKVSQAEVQELRNQVGAMSKELTEQREINERLQGGAQ